MKATFTKHITVSQTREAIVSDFSETEIPKLHWQAVTRFRAETTDGAGNKTREWKLDLLPEEMADLCSEIDRLIGSLAAKYKARKVRKS